MSIRRSHSNQSKKAKRWDIADRRSNRGGAGDPKTMGRARWLKPRDRRRLD